MNRFTLIQFSSSFSGRVNHCWRSFYCSPSSKVCNTIPNIASKRIKWMLFVISVKRNYSILVFIGWWEYFTIFRAYFHGLVVSLECMITNNDNANCFSLWSLLKCTREMMRFFFPLPFRNATQAAVLITWKLFSFHTFWNDLYSTWSIFIFIILYHIWFSVIQNE